MDTLFLGSGTSVFAFLGESKLNLVAGIVLLAAALWSLVAIVTAIVAPPKRRSVRFGLFTALNVVLSVAGLVYSAVVALEKACVIAVASSIPADNAFLVAIVDLITLGADRAVFRYALYSATALAVIAFIVTLARARRPQFIGPVAMAKDDGYVLVDDGEAPEETEITDEPTEPETERAETEEITDKVTTEEFVEKPETEETEATDEPEEKEETEEPEETSTDNEEVEETEEIGTEAEEEEKPETEEPETEENEPVAENDEEDEPAVPISVARKRIADMGSVLGKLDDLFDNSAFSVEESAYIGKSEEKPAPEPEQEKKEEETERKEENSDLDSVENILGRILAATRSTVKPAPSVAKPIEKKAAEKPKKAVKPEPSVEEIFAEAEENVADDEKEVPQTAEPEKIVVDEKIREDAAIAKTERKRAGRVRTIGRAAELFDEYLSAQSDEDKKKLAESIDCIVVDKDKK